MSAKVISIDRKPVLPVQAPKPEPTQEPSCKTEKLEGARISVVPTIEAPTQTRCLRAGEMTKNDG